MLKIDDLTEKQLDNVSASLICDGKIYHGACFYDDVELEENNKAQAMFYVWQNFDEPAVEIRDSYFPQDPEIFQRIKFVIES